jgi:PAS domain-containing protein
VQKRFYIDYEYHFEANRDVSWRYAVNDVTSKVVARMKIEENEKKFRLLADSMPQHIWTSDGRENLNYFNKSILDYSGLISHK